MGVAGLLEALAVEAEEVVWPGKVRGAAIGIDISVWLHELATRHYQSVVLLKKYDDVVAAVEERARAYARVPGDARWWLQQDRPARHA